jgi:pilus assembly protein Flp/PilA
MQNFFKKLMNAPILRDETGQDLIEYVLIIAIIAFAATVGMATVASKINLAFGNVGSKLDKYVT